VERLGREPQWDEVPQLRHELAALGDLTLCTATDGNHGRAVARMARLLGYGASIFVPAGTAEARIAAIEREGARVTVVDGTYDEAVVASAACASERVLVVSGTSWPGYEQVPRWVVDGYSTIFGEVDAQLDADYGGERPSIVVAQMGVGALAAAVVTHYASSATIVVVEPHRAACGLRSAEAGEPVSVPGPHDSVMAGLNCGTVSLIAWPRLQAGVDVFVAIDDAAAEQAMRDLDSIGVTAGESGAAGLAGLRALQASHALDIGGERALVVSTEGATDPRAYERIVGHAP
jgi:diaminopropionate ammonia-lyase